MKKMTGIVCILLLFACTKNRQPSYDTLQPQMIHLAPEFTDKDLQISGLDWYGDTLFFLNQIPSEYNDTVFFSTRDEIQASINTRGTLRLHRMRFQQDSVVKRLGFVPDYEAIAFKGDSVYLLIEAEKPMRSFIVMGSITPAALQLHAHTLREIPIANNLYEIACEAMLISRNALFVFYESYGANVNRNAQVYCFDLSLNSLPAVDFEAIEYRITDATQIMNDQSFWVINRFWPGERKLLNPADEKFIPSTFLDNDLGVNRLIQLQIADNSIHVKNYHPVMLPPQGWNWEGLAALDSSTFLIINDEFSSPPYRTGLAYINIAGDQ